MCNKINKFIKRIYKIEVFGYKHGDVFAEITYLICGLFKFKKPFNDFTLSDDYKVIGFDPKYCSKDIDIVFNYNCE